MRNFIFVFILLTSGCVTVNGHIRPQWNPSWSKVTCIKPGNTQAGIEFTVYDDQGQTLPGANILLVDSFDKHHNFLARNNGSAVFVSDSGNFKATIEIEGFDSLRVNIKQLAGYLCKVEATLFPKLSEPIVSINKNENM